MTRAPIFFASIAGLVLAGSCSAQPAKQPNLHVDVAAALVNAVVARAVDRTEPVDETIQETPVRGTGRTIGAIHAELVPDAQAGTIDVVFRGYNFSRTVGTRPNVFIHTSTATALEVRRRVTFDRTAIRTSAGAARGDSYTTLLGIQSRTWPEQLTVQLAQRVYDQSLDAAEAESAAKTAGQLSQRINTELTPLLGSLSQSIGREVKRFQRAGLKLEALEFRTTAQTLHASLRFAAPPPSRPSGALPADTALGLRVHETLVNRESELELGGHAFKLEEVAQVYLKVTRGLVRDGRKNVDPNDALKKLEKFAALFAKNPATITFAKQAPVTLVFAEQGFRVEFRFASLRQENKEFAGLRVGASYRFENAGDGVHAVRLGAIRFAPFEEPTKDGKKLPPLPAPFRLLQNAVFGEVLTERLMLTLPPMPAALARVKLQAPAAYARDGWFGLAWTMK